MGNIDFKAVFKLGLWSFPGSVIGFFLVAALFTLITHGAAALPSVISAPLGATSFLSAVGYSFIFALMFGFNAWQYLASGQGFDMRRVLILGLFWGGLNFFFAIFQWPGLIAVLALFWQGVAMAVGAYLVLLLASRK
jgi:hypothetical protein